MLRLLCVRAAQTKTVVCVLNSLHLRAYQVHYSSLIESLLTVPRSVLAELRRGALGDSPAAPITLDGLVSDLSSSLSSAFQANPFSSSPRVLPKPRLLVCAPSNAGVDEIISRVLGVSGAGGGGGGFVDGSLVRYSPDVVRIGQSESVREEVKARISLDVLVDGYLSLSAEQLEQRSRHAVRARADTTRELSSWLQTYRKRWEACMRERGEGRPEPKPAEVVEPQFLSSVAHLHERLHLATLDFDRCQSILTLYSHGASASSSSPASASSPPSLRRAERQAAIDRLRLSFLNEAHIVFSTLSGAGLPLLSSSQSSPFSALLVDEAAQATELATLVAFRHNVQHVVLVGDPKQLPATVFLSAEAEGREAVERSLFERLQAGGEPVIALLVQYRMHAEIRAFPSRYFYENALRDGDNVSGPAYTRRFHSHPLLRPFLFFDVHLPHYEAGADVAALQALLRAFPLEQVRSAGNVVEAAMVVRLVQMLLTLYGDAVGEGGVRGSHVGIITFYQQQKRLLEAMLRSAPASATADGLQAVEVSTVDGFQGREKEIILVSCVRQRGGRGGGGGGAAGGRRSIGFVSDIRRMNVALTRGKWATWLCGDAAVLSNGSQQWKALMDDAARRGLVRRWSDVQRLDHRFLPLQREEEGQTQAGETDNSSQAGRAEYACKGRAASRCSFGCISRRASAIVRESVIALLLCWLSVLVVAHSRLLTEQGRLLVSNAAAC